MGFHEQIAGVADDLAGSTDEAVARTFDDRPGDGVVAGIKDATGIRAYRASDSFEEQSQQFRENADDNSIGAHLGRLDTAARAGFDFALDNPKASVQETVQGGMVDAFNFASGDDDATDEDVAAAFEDAATAYSATTSEALEGTPLDNAATDTVVGGFDVFVGDPAKAAFKGATGVNLQGDSEATVGATEAFDVGVTVGTAGVGKAGLAAAKGTAKGSGLLARLGAATDESVKVADEAAQGADEAAQAATDVERVGNVNRANDPFLTSGDEAAQATDEAAQGTDDVIDLERAGSSESGFARFVTSTDEAAQASDDALPALSRAGDEAVQATDDATGTFTSRVIGGSDEAAQGADEAAQAADEAAGGADDGGSLLDDVLGGTDEAAQASDEAAQAADEAAQAADETPGIVSRATSLLSRSGDEGAGLLSRALSSRAGKVGAGTGLFLAGGAATQIGGNLDDAPDEIETASGHRLTYAKDFEPTEQYPNGGVLYAVTKDFQNIGYWVLLGIQGRNLMVLDDSGDPRRAKINADQFKQLAGRQSRQGGKAA